MTSLLPRTLASPQLYVDFFDPFSCECRVYGRLKEEGREDLAVRAHGYLLLTAEQEAQVLRHDPELDARWRRTEEFRHLPIRAIVKDLATDPEPFTQAHLSSMWEDLEGLHRLGILVRDIGIFDYIGGKLIDFSRSWTMPHPSLKFIHLYHIHQERRRDPSRLYGVMVDYAFGEQWDDFDWEVDIPEGLRKCQLEGAGPGDGYGIDPRNYDWARWEDDPIGALDALKPENLFLEKSLDPLCHEEAESSAGDRL